ncbi:MAG: hypothetical protein ACREQK_13345 [Candidatus Binatia bacterium]
MTCQNSSQVRVSTLSLIILVAGALSLHYGCARTAAPDPVQREELFRLTEQPEIKVVYYPPVALEVYRTKDTSSAAARGPIDPVAEGSRLRNRFALEDPALQVKERIVLLLAFEFGFKNITSVLHVRLADNVDTLKMDFKEGALIDFRTLGWALGRLPAPHSYSGLLYSARARLIRLNPSSVVWEGKCLVQTKDLSLEQLEARDAAPLKETLPGIANACAAQLATQLRGKAK